MKEKGSAETQPLTMGRSTATIAVRQKGTSLWADAWRRLKRNRAATVSIAILVMLVFLAIVGPAAWPYPYDKQNLMASNERPSREHPLGTNSLGQDQLARLLMGARVSLAVALVAQLVILLIGVPAGLVAGFFGGWVDNLIMRAVEILYSIPVLLMIILIMTTLREVIDQATGPVAHLLSLLDKATGGLLGTIIGISIIAWIVVARLVRGEVLTLKEREFVVAARSVGASDSKIIRRHLLPNILSVVIVAASFGIPQAIFLEAGLSFMGLGVRPPMPSWGLMIAEGARAIRSYPYLVWPPAMALAITMIAFTFLGDGLRDALDPRQMR